MSTSLVAGASGFLGSNLTKALLERGHRVVGLDNHLTGSPKNLAKVCNSLAFEFIKASVLDLDDIELPPLDYIFHFASPASPPSYQKYALETLQVNSIGSAKLAELAKKNNARLVFASTSEIYGDPLVSPQGETYWGNVNPIGPRSMYDEAKRFGEALLAQYRRQFKTDVGIVRIFNTYGPSMDPFDGRVVSNFIRQGLEGLPFSIYGDGSQTRSFCYVDDLVAGIISVAQSDYFGPINLGNPNEITLIDLAHAVAKTLNIEAKFVFQPLPEDDPKQRRPDIELAKKLLAWQPKVSLSEGIQKAATWMREELSASQLA